VQGKLLDSSSFPSFLHLRGGDGIKNVVNEMMRLSYIRFHCHIWGGCGSKYIENCSHRLKMFVHHFIADSREVFRLNNHVFARAYV
ncbi:MAG: hypothetical protein NWF14_03165, partial [Candidatus Bathyarchaeota archaeon]|nr:hypothetical protein [Candidatus Bathyarchaeota archaeon]